MNNTIQNDILEMTARDLKEIDNQDFIVFQAAAQKFLDQVQMLSDSYKKIITKNSLKNKIIELYKNMRQDSVYTQTVLQYQHEFEVALNNFLGRTIYLSYVVPDGNLYFYGDVNIGELYRQATANKGRGNISQTKMFDANDLEEDLKKDILKSIADRKKVYQEALARYRRNKGEEHMNYNISERTFYWWAQYHKKLAGWTDPIVNEGPIAEGYAGAVINQDPEVKNTRIEHSLEVLWYNHIQKDSIGAAIKGDIVLKSDGNIQFAVKSGSFSTAKIRQYILLAYNVLKLKNLTIRDLSNPEIFKRLSSGGLSRMTDQIIEALNDKVITTVDESVY